MEKEKKQRILKLLIKIPKFGLMASCAYLLIILVKECKVSHWNYVPKETRTSKIFSLELDSNTSGNFILGIGSVNQQEYYVFYRETASKGLIREKIPADLCILYETDSNPILVEKGKMGYQLFGNDTISRQFIRDRGAYQLIYIPKGTIRKELTNL